MNKYLQLIKSEKRAGSAGSKGSKGTSEPFEPATGSHNQQIARPSILSVHASEPFEPAPDRHIEKLNCANRTLADNNTSQLKNVKDTGGIGSKGSQGASEPFEPTLGRRGSNYADVQRAASGGAAETPPLDCVGALHHPDGGPYLPWGPYVEPGQLQQMQRDLLAAVEELARFERWPDEYFDHVVYCIERQPISTLRPDLAYFNARLRIARNSRGGP
ncbi:hypothetical protein G5S35_04495 [Paraburkholderia tropica]|uniref:hypothetical protein n=1 Tax=Paraburkholderia tropica TaxID=92647 RepID=UPI0015FF679F|nr:hypothetical protein [Paraburkholderia tropica]QNB10903.1 hypothetical protein G5S35_04495 [Paraburkholderia tropica]